MLVKGLRAIDHGFIYEEFRSDYIARWERHLTHSLHCSREGTQDNDQVHRPWLRPTVGEFMLQDLFFVRGQLGNAGVPLRRLGQDSSQFEGADIGFVAHLMSNSEVVAMLSQVAMAEAGEGIGEFRIQIAPGPFGSSPESRLRHECVFIFILSDLSALLDGSFGENAQVIFPGHLESSDLATKVVAVVLAAERYQSARLQTRSNCNRGSCSNDDRSR